MKILYLGPKNDTIISFLNSEGHIVIQEERRITLDAIERNNFEYALSFGYRHIIKKDIINYFKNKIINLHISYLPYNRGADPNFWSFIDNTPKGVTIHQIDEGIDTGDILLQKKIFFDMNKDTLASSYNKLIKEIEKLLINNFRDIAQNFIAPKKQVGKGTFHRSIDKKKYNYLLNNLKWKTLVKDLIMVRENENSKF